MRARRRASYRREGAGAPLTELVIRSEGMADLLQPPTPELAARLGRIDSGIDDILLHLDAERLPSRLRTTIVLPATLVDATGLRSTLSEHCRLRLRSADLRLRAQRRETTRLLLIGGWLFLLGVLLSFEFLQQRWPPIVQDLLGDGVFLVLAWVGLWYPLDHLIFSRRTVARERNLLRAVQDMEVVVRPISGTDL